MRLIKPSFKIIEQQAGLEGMYKQIELAGRTCYKSEDKITPDSAKAFVDRMIKSGHGAMLEHGTVYLKFETVKSTIHPLDKYYNNKYSKVCTEEGLTKQTKIVFVTTNYRVLVENDWLDDLQYICEPTEFHEKRVTVKFICDRGVSHEFVRHRVFSFAQESTRYCNYSKDKFGNELTFIIPCWTNLKSVDYSHYDGSQEDWFDLTESEKAFINAIRDSQRQYLYLITCGNWKPQQARAILPNALKTELVMTGFVSDWKHFFELRDAASAHPQAQELAHPLHEAFIQRGLVE